MFGWENEDSLETRINRYIKLLKQDLHDFKKNYVNYGVPTASGKEVENIIMSLELILENRYIFNDLYSIVSFRISKMINYRIINHKYSGGNQNYAYFMVESAIAIIKEYKSDIKSFGVLRYDMYKHIDYILKITKPEILYDMQFAESITTNILKGINFK